MKELTNYFFRYSFKGNLINTVFFLLKKTYIYIQRKINRKYFYPENIRVLIEGYMCNLKIKNDTIPLMNGLPESFVNFKYQNFNSDDIENKYYFNRLHWIFHRPDVEIELLSWIMDANKSHCQDSYSSSERIVNILLYKKIVNNI
jgi:hypothetical protein